MIRVNNQLAFAAEPSVTLGKPTGDLTLKIFHGNRQTKEVRVASSKCSIGRSSGCTIELNDPGIQPVHCVILRGTGKTVVRRWAPNAWLNGEHFVDAVLHSGDELRLANVTIKVLFDGEQSSANSSADQQLVHYRPCPTPSSSQLDQLVERLHAAESRVQQLQTEVSSNQHNAAAIGERIKRIERLVRSDSAKRYQRQLTQLRKDKSELERQWTALEFRRREERAFWQLELDRVAAELARQTEQNLLEQRKAAAQAKRIADLEACSGSAQATVQNHKLARAEKQLQDHIATLESVREQLSSQQTRHEAESKAINDALQRSQRKLTETQQQLQAKQNEISTEQIARQQLESAHADHIAQLELAIQQNREQCDRLTSQLESQRASHEQGLRARDTQISQLESELREYEATCQQLREQLAAAHQGESLHEELTGQVRHLESQLQDLQSQRDELHAELEEVKSTGLRQLDQQKQQLEEALSASHSECQLVRAELESALSSIADGQQVRDDELVKLTDQLHQTELSRTELEAALTQVREEQTTLTERVQQLEGQVEQLEGEVEQRSQKIQQLEETLAQADQSSADNEAELATRIANLQSELLQNTKQRDTLQAKIDELLSANQSTTDDRIEQLQAALEESQQLRDTLQEELENYQVSAATESEEWKNQQSELAEQHNALAERCQELETECARLHEQINTEQLATEGREQENLMAQQELDQRIDQLQQELSSRQLDWESRETALNETIESLQQQLVEFQNRSQLDEGQADSHGSPDVDAMDQQDTTDSNDWPQDSVSTEAETIDQWESADSCEAPCAETSAANAQPASRFNDVADTFEQPHELDAHHHGAQDFVESDEQDDPFAAALHGIEAVIPKSESESQNAATESEFNVGDDFSEAFQPPLDARDENGTSDVPADVEAPATSFETNDFDNNEEFGATTFDENQPFGEGATEETNEPHDAQDAFQPANSAEADLLARIRAMTGQDDPTSSDEDDDDDDVEASITQENDEDDVEDPTAEGSRVKSEDLSIEDYMQRLLNRVGSAEPVQQPQNKSQTVVMDDNQLSSPQRIESKRSTNPLSSSSNRERPVRKLTAAELGAMRELANESTRSALNVHAKKSTEKAALSTLLTAIICFATAGILLIPTRGEFSALFVCGALVMIIAVYFGYRAFRAGAVALIMTALEKSKKSSAKSEKKSVPATPVDGSSVTPVLGHEQDQHVLDSGEAVGVSNGTSRDA